MVNETVPWSDFHFKECRKVNYLIQPHISSKYTGVNYPTTSILPPPAGAEGLRNSGQFSNIRKP